MISGESIDSEDVMRVRNDLADEFVTPEWAVAPVGEPYDPFDDDTPLVCGLENPEYCDTCQ